MMGTKVVSICDVCKEIFAGGDAPKNRFSEIKTEEFSIPIYSNGEAKNGLYGYTDYFRVDVPSITVSARGTIGYAAIRYEPFVPIVRLITLVPNMNIIDIDYLYYAVQNYKFINNGTSIPQLTVPMIKKYSFPLPNIQQQKQISGKLNKITDIIDKRKQQIFKLDELVKARFVEMFGDPVANPHGFDKVDLSKLADIKIGPFGSLLHKEDYIEGGHALLNPSHIVDGKISPDNKLTVSPEKYEELSAYQLKAGDVVMGRRGEMGRCAVVPCDGYLCGTGSLMIRTNGDVTADYIQKIISFPSFKKNIEDMAVGQTMPNLNVPIVSSFQIIKPPIEVQHSYYAFVKQVDKSKSEIQKSLDKLEMLKKALMQKYFG